MKETFSMREVVGDDHRAAKERENGYSGVQLKRREGKDESRATVLLPRAATRIEPPFYIYFIFIF